ncbi:Flp family type IVb pilin [Hyphomicrobium sulfonivorans]|uniref:Flp family type IVb pilin n=1 Tax=Hyphomicrobium sulfonivorans TaxID=121290 RepID=UPI001570E49E|nr:Flp family type IVb pilin [Hyphomicrobium sulfonivorans]MBI1649903.1 Flp family type IVb pilin [Hyphomicrobium sulfonivorans]NSL72821.1 Flp family type IVb pilin [Hyphomicrobium sulfonivorans]
MKNFVSRFAQDESGATAIEYGLLAALIGVAIVVGATAVGTNLDKMLTDISEKLKM